MQILFYIPDINQTWGGVRQYAITLLKMLQKDFENHYYIYHDLNDSDILEAIDQIPNQTLVTTEIIKDPKIITVKVPDKRFSRIPGLRRLKVEQQVIIESDLAAYCKKHGIQTIYCPYQFIPKVDNVKLITTLHDVQELHFPEFFSAEDRAYRATSYLDFLRRADAVVVSYQHIKDDLIKYFNVPSSKINVILLEMQNLWFEKFSNSNSIDISVLDLPENFLLYPANTWKHKNHLRLIKAIAEARERYNVIINLVCTGHKNEHYSEIEKLIHHLKLEDQIFFTGIVEENILYSLYETSRGVVIPTTYEAGSFPLYESIFLNVRVICSNVTSLPETIGKNEYVFNPFEVKEITDLIIKLWNDHMFREKNLEHIVGRAKYLTSKNNSLSKITSVYSTLNES